MWGAREGERLEAVNLGLSAAIVCGAASPTGGDRARDQSSASSGWRVITGRASQSIDPGFAIQMLSIPSERQSGSK